MFNRYYWYTPPVDILQSELTQCRETIPNPEYIAQILCQAGLQCHAKDYTNGAQIVTYHIQLTNPIDYPKATRAIRCLSAAIYSPCRQTISDHASFAVQICKQDRRVVTLRQSIAHMTVRTPTSAIIGLDDCARPVCLDIANLPHMLIAGATGSGKSVALNTIICSMLFNATPTMTQFIMVDPKQVELSAYAGLPHLACPIITSPQSAVDILQRINATMDERYKIMAKKHLKMLSEETPRIVVVIDELADLMLTSKRAVEESIIRIAQLGRAAGIHLLIATQKPVVSVVTGLIQGNIPCKLALQTASVHDSVRILGHKGAETLIGKGDALLKLPDRVEETRIQCAYTSSEDVAAVVNYWRYNAKCKQ